VSAAEKRVALAAETIRAAWERRVVADPQTDAAQALESAGLLMSPEKAAELESLRARVAELEAAAYGDAEVRLLSPVEQIRHLHACVAAQMSRAGTLDRLCREQRARVAELEVERHSTNEALDDAVQALRKGETAEVFVPRTERSYWVDIAEALNAAHAAGMPVGIDLDGTLTDHNAWSVVWDRAAERWSVAGYEDESAEADAPEVPALTVFRASHESIVMGLYATAAEARKHCETVVRREHAETTKVELWWREDEDTVDQPEFGVMELIESTAPHYARPTGYVVTPLEVASAFDEEADE